MRYSTGGVFVRPQKFRIVQEKNVLHCLLAAYKKLGDALFQKQMKILISKTKSRKSQRLKKRKKKEETVANIESLIENLFKDTKMGEKTHNKFNFLTGIFIQKLAKWQTMFLTSNPFKLEIRDNIKTI